MAPTEILADQHFRKLTKLLSQARVRFGLLTGGTPPAEKRSSSRRRWHRRDRHRRRHARLIEENVDFATSASSSWTSSTSSASCSAPAPRQGRHPALPRHDRHAHPAHAHADRLRRPRRLDHRQTARPGRQPITRVDPAEQARRGVRVHPQAPRRRPAGVLRLPAG